MTVKIVTPPSPIVSPTDVRTRLGVMDLDAVLTPLIAAVCAQIEPPFGWVGRAFGRQTLEQRGNWFADCWGGAELRLRYPPLVSVTSLKYTDTNGVEQTIDPSGYSVLGLGSSDVTRISLSYGGTWPTVRSGPEAVRVRYEAGYESGDPKLEPAKNAVVLMVKQLLGLSTRDLQLSRDEVPGVGSKTYVLSEVAAKIVGTAADSLLQGYRVW